MERIEIGTNKRPKLRDKEVIKAITKQVILRTEVQNATKSTTKGRSEGTLYTTNQRLVFVDSKHVQTNSKSINFWEILEVEEEKTILRTRAKVILTLKDGNKEKRIDEQRNGGRVKEGEGEGEGSGGSKVSELGVETVLGAWECEICQHINEITSNTKSRKCELCGIVDREERTSNITEIMERTSMGKQNEVVKEEGSKSMSKSKSKEEEEGKECKVCTFINHRDMRYCEMCENIFEEEQEEEKGKENEKEEELMEWIDDIVERENEKVVFEMQGTISIARMLRQLIEECENEREKEKEKEKEQEKEREEKEEEVGTGTGAGAGTGTGLGVGVGVGMGEMGVGVARLMRNMEDGQRASKQALGEAFVDLEGLKGKAEQLVEVAQRLVRKLEPGREGKEEGFGKYLEVMGLDDPVTKDAAGAAYHEELAKELSGFVEEYVEKAGGSVAVVELYCLYNRARGMTQLVYPADFVAACRKFETLQLPLELKQFSSGVLAVERNKRADVGGVYERLAAYVQSFGGLSALDYAALEEVPVVRAREYLTGAEEGGIVCRDEQHGEVRYYPNEFKQWAKNLTAEYIIDQVK